ncbi:hypothetical protein Cni_G07841 [Canna indica]|uniref:DUF309 domain-containing protein n=1 Tax=Canna indica TaxID=4628 RepID=A0AAQ3Q7Z5_9LILI|nr:hypothetical protein Cni_G07841 [Canna indica]
MAPLTGCRFQENTFQRENTAEGCDRRQIEYRLSNAFEAMACASRFASSPILLIRSPSPSRPAKSSVFRSRPAGLRLRSADLRTRRRLLGGGSEYSPEDDYPNGRGASFGRAVELFNCGEYYQCHDFLEELWHGAEEPIRTLLHGVLQCAVGFHHLFNQNHRGAMMELGEGLCKLRKLDIEDGPFLQFEEEVSAALEFLYQTQKELAACTSEMCLAMDGSERSYQLLGSFAAGQHLYRLSFDQHGVAYITFFLAPENSSYEALKVKVPTLHATDEHLRAFEYRC